MGVTESAVSIVNNSTLQTYGSLAFRAVAMCMWHHDRD